MLNSSGKLDYEELGLFDPRCQWLDANVTLARNFHFLNENHDRPIVLRLPTTVGDSFPMAANLDREGLAFSSVQLPIQNRIIALRDKIVNSSDDFDKGDSWFMDLRSLIIDCVTMIEITLHKIYLKAEYSPLSGWAFDPQKLGERHGRRVLDKLKWVFQITGNHLDAEKQIKSFTALKDLRNHLNHFDPPFFV